CEIYDHCVLGKLPTSPGITSRKLKVEYPKLIIGDNSILCPGVVLYAGTTIGCNNLLGDFCSIREECTVGSNCIISRNVSINYNTIIGDHTKIMDNTHITGNMKIGSHVFISVLVATTNDNTMGRIEYDEDHVQGATIGDHVTVGAAANILPGVNIGENAIIGASALVTKDVPANKVVMGVPARIVRDVE
ncbi:DapH/DapD/GlmU-related protein, partial [Bacteroides congonensis]|uniref:acyltransferase n=1 Tax=Bacteroides congonensis TaxID=1871006 RepID=UPI00321BFCED